MKSGYAFIFVLNLLVSLALAWAVIVLFSKEQAKERMIQDLEAQRQSDQQKAVKARQELDAQKEFEAQMKLGAAKELEQKKMRLINDDLDRIDARLQRVLDQPSGFADQTKAQRDTQEELLRELASCARTEIGVLMGEMQNAGFTNNDVLSERLADFFKNYQNKIHDEHMSYDYIDLGFTDSDRKKELDTESAQSLQLAFGARRAIHGLKQNPKDVAE